MILKLGPDLGKLVELWGFEPQTSCMPCTLRPSPDVAGRGLMWRSPAASVAGRGLAWPGDGARWLPTWLPGQSLAPLKSGDPGALLSLGRAKAFCATLFGWIGSSGGTAQRDATGSARPMRYT